MWCKHSKSLVVYPEDDSKVEDFDGFCQSVTSNQSVVRFQETIRNMQWSNDG